MNTEFMSRDPVDDAQALVAAVEATLKELAERVGGLDALEQAEEARIRQACARLLQYAVELDGAQLMVAGSTGQARPHPLLKCEQDGRREIIDALNKLVFSADQRVMFETGKAMTVELEDEPKPKSKPRAKEQR